jgi:hypothetical protein
VLVGVVLSGFVLGMTATGSVAQGTSLIADLSGDNELDGGDPDGEGEFTATLRRRRLCYELDFSGLTNPNAAHIHRGADDEDGPIVQSLRPQWTQDEDGARPRCVRIRRTLARRIRNDDTDYYVNVHTDDYPDGAIRGQLELE